MKTIILSIDTEVGYTAEGKVIVIGGPGVIDQLWEILHNTEEIYELGAFTMDRHKDSKDTCYLFTPNRGFTAVDVFHIVAAGAYIATVWNGNLTEFWQKSIEAHVDSIGTTIKIQSAFDRKTAVLVITEWIRRMAITKAAAKIRDINLTGAVNNIAEDRFESAREAIRRLDYERPSSFGGLIIEKWSRQNQTAQLLEELRLDKLHLEGLIKESDHLRKSFEASAQSFITIFEKAEALTEMHLKLWESISHQHYLLKDRLDEILRTYNGNPGKEIYRQLVLLCPPAK